MRHDPTPMPFTPANWYWIVGDNETRYWSSAAGAYVTTLPDGARPTRIANEQELADVLRPYGIAAPLISSEDVSAERDRRIALGASVTIGSVTFTVQTRNETDFRNLNGLVSKGILLLMQSDVTTTTTFRDADNVDRVLNAQGLVSMGSQVAAHVDAIYKSSWVIKSLNPIPADFKSDKYWST
jgi:hypothetical protein